MGAGPLRLVTRGSRLALHQANLVATRLPVDVELVVVSTTGDQRADTPIWEMGGRGVFVKEVQDAVLDGRGDAAVHSAKDLPSQTPDGLVIAAVPERADPRDCLVGTDLADLPTGAVVATGSVRRRAQLAAVRPDLTFAPLRGNIETRVAKAQDVDAAVAALAAIVRLDLDAPTHALDPSVMLPQVGQGTLAVECRADDDETLDALAALDDPAARTALTAERAFLATVGGGCNLPVGALATVEDGGVRVEGLVATLDGRTVLRHAVSGADPAEAGERLARELFEERGGAALLEGS